MPLSSLLRLSFRRSILSFIVPISIDHQYFIIRRKSKSGARAVSSARRYCIILHSMARHRYAKSLAGACKIDAGKKPMTVTNPPQFERTSLRRRRFGTGTQELSRKSSEVSSHGINHHSLLRQFIGSDVNDRESAIVQCYRTTMVLSNFLF